MIALVFGMLIVGRTFCATIPPQTDNSVVELSPTPISDTFDIVYDQARSAVVGLYNLLTIPFTILANSKQMELSNQERSMDAIQGIFQATNRALQRATDSITNVLTINAQEPNSDPLLRIFQQVVGNRAADGAANSTGLMRTMQSLPLLQHVLGFSNRASSQK